MEDIRNKIRKLLALATSSNEHEATLAMEKATDLALQHDLDLDDLNGPERKFQKRNLLDLKIDLRYYMAGYVHLLGHAISHIAPVRLYIVSSIKTKTKLVDGKQVVVKQTVAKTGYGYVQLAALSSNQLDLGEALLRYLLDSVQRQWKQSAKPAGLNAMEAWRLQRGFKLGAAGRLWERTKRMKEEREGKVMTGNGRSLVVGPQLKQDLKDIEAGVGGVVTDNREMKLREMDQVGMKSGRAAAEKIGLNDQLGTSSVPESRRLR